MYTNIFWTDVGNYFSHKTGKTLKFSFWAVMTGWTRTLLALKGFSYPCQTEGGFPEGSQSFTVGLCHLALLLH